MARVSPQLVGDDHDREPFDPQLLDAGEEGVDLLRGEHAGGLVEDDERAPAISTLRISTRWRSPIDRRRTNASGSTARPKRSLASLMLRAERPPVEAQAVQVERERDVLGDGERGDQAQVLEHHADAGGRGPRPASGAAPASPSTSTVPASGAYTP